MYHFEHRFLSVHDLPILRRESRHFLIDVSAILGEEEPEDLIPHSGLLLVEQEIHLFLVCLHYLAETLGNLFLTGLTKS